MIFETILPIFAQTILPVFLVAGAGALLAWRIPLDNRTLGRTIFYLATPALVFRSLYQMEIDYGALQRIAAVAVTVAVATGIMGWVAGYDQSRERRAAFVLTSAVPNNGNMGLPICLFAFGPSGLALGSVYYVISSFLSNTFGVVIASAGQAPFAVAVRQSLRVPVLYAAIIGLAMNRTGLTLPVGVFRAIDLLASAAIPGMLIVLGMQLIHAPLRQRQFVILRATAIRLIAAPILAWIVCRLMGVDGLEADVITLQAAMPTAVMTTVLATEFETAPRLVATVVFFTTLFSMLTLSVVLWYIL